jgi:K+ transporter
MASSIKGTCNESLVDVTRNVKDAFGFCKESGLEIEVMATAFILLKENPTFDIEYAIWQALQDWDV